MSTSLQSFDDNFFTLESTPAANFVAESSPLISISSNQDPFSPQCSPPSYLSNSLLSLENAHGSPFSGFSYINGECDVDDMMREFEVDMVCPSSDFNDSCEIPKGAVPFPMNYNKMLKNHPGLDVKQALNACADALSEGDIANANVWIEVLEGMVSVSGDPIQRLGAYMLEGLRARILLSGSTIYKKLRCKEPTSPELMSYMHFLSEVCPYYKFAYTSSNVVIMEAMANERRIHIIDFLIAQGSQWVSFIQDLARRPNGPFSLRITGVDDYDSAYARDSGLQLVGQRLAKVAKSCGVQFAFHPAAISGPEVDWSTLGLVEGEARAVNFPYMLHHMPDESVSTVNHRDRLIRLVKRLNPRVVTLLEQELYTNNSLFPRRFREAVNFYSAMFESIDAGCPREDEKRISAEEHCVARDIMNVIACEEFERLERHEPLEKWKFRMTAAGFVQCPLNYSVGTAVTEVLKGYSRNYTLLQKDGALYLGWKNRAMVTCSAWR